MTGHEQASARAADTHGIEDTFHDWPTDLDRLHTLRVWHTMWLRRIDAKMAAITQRQTEEEHRRRIRPAARPRREMSWTSSLLVANPRSSGIFATRQRLRPSGVAGDAQVLVVVTRHRCLFPERLAPSVPDRCRAYVARETPRVGRTR
jgi:hypothetical protein